jgi:nucleoside-diphosphate kinase
MAVEGPNAIGVVRSMGGATRPWEAAPGTIRGDLALEVAQNLIHASDGPETAEAELALRFPEGTLAYTREIDRWALAPGG